MANLWDKGDLVRLKGTAKNAAAALADPTTVTFKIEDPDGVKTTYVYLTDAQLKRDSLGVFYVDWPMAKVGKHTWRIETTGDPQQAEEQFFEVKATRF